VVSPFLPADRAPEGLLDFEGAGVFGADTLAADVGFAVGRGRIGRHGVDGAQGRVAFRDDRATFQNVSARLPFASVDVSGDLLVAGGGLRSAIGDSTARARALERATFRAFSARVESADFQWLWDRIPKVPVDGAAGSVVLRVEGPFLNPSAEIEAELSGGRLGPEALDSFEARGSFDGEVLEIRGGRLASGNGTIALDGTLPLEWTAADPEPRLRAGRDVNLRLQGRAFPLAAISPLVPLFTLLTGTADANLELRGQPGALRFDGDFSLAGGRLVIATFDEPLVNGIAAGRFDESGIEIESARFEDGRDGVVVGHGRVPLANLRATDCAIDVTARDYHYRSELTGIRGVGSGGMKILARTTAAGRLLPFFQGRFNVSRADVAEAALVPPSARGATSDLPSGIVAPPEEMTAAAAHPQSPEGPSPETAAGPLAAPATPAPVLVLADIALRADRNVWLKTREMDLEMAGDLVFESTERHMGIRGEVHTLRGSYAVLNTRFDVQRAEVEFTDPANVGSSYIDAEATTTVLDEKVTAVVTGTLAAPMIRLSTESGMAESEIYEMLALRIKRADSAGTEGTAAEEPGLAGKAFRDSYLAALTNRFGGQLGREIGLDTFAYDVGEEGTRSSVTVGKNVGSDFFFTYRQAVGGNGDETADPSATRESLETPERALTIEYRLNRFFMLQGETGTLPLGDDYLNVDLRAEWGY
jgi:autotransporter translocation and assembly factor TamB